MVPVELSQEQKSVAVAAILVTSGASEVAARTIPPVDEVSEAVV